MTEQMQNVLCGIIKGIAKLMGEDTEVALHDLSKGEIVAIENGYITGRAAGYRLDAGIYDLILKLADAEGHLIGYNSKTAKGAALRSSHFIVRDESGQPAALICVNQDTAKLQMARDLLDGMLTTKQDVDKKTAEPTDENIQAMVQRVILNVIERNKPFGADDRDRKQEILRELSDKGVFAVKDSVPYVCKMLSISQATLYNYLREIRSGKTDFTGLTLNL